MRGRQTEKRRIRCGRAIALSAGCLLLFAGLAGCSGLKDAREIKNAPMPPRYVETKEREVPAAEGSLWANRIFLYEDLKARRVNDLVTILITETTTASKKAVTNANRESTADNTITNLFGMKVDNVPVLNDLSKGVNGQGKSDFNGSGDTSREGTLSATITAKVVEVLPNNNLVIESRKEVVVNNEKEIIVLRGIVRPHDISANNAVYSQYVADAQIYLVGDGVLDDKQAQGWLVRLMDKVWPF
ncbi:MAG: flagellar basal body L-ring protein FlgH [Alphaproteobacteria bacterium]|uniref:Flagellar L-ring protein n=1 Tax=Candidatus Nitrobium versatile TaxID=2884831 RepID=A0A953JC93_9BACT|nr:flagellar basal body L-ring protein FlgH [Candidatus Nitrobium versatile]